MTFKQAISWFEIPAEDLNRAQKSVFHLPLAQSLWSLLSPTEISRYNRWPGHQKAYLIGFNSSI